MGQTLRFRLVGLVIFINNCTIKTMNYLIAALISGVVSIGAFFGIQKTQDTPTLGTVQPVAGTTYTLAGGGISSSATSITLSSFTIPQTGQKIQDSDLSDTFYITIAPGNQTRQELVSCTTVTQSTVTATLSGCTRGLSPIPPYTASTTLRFNHAGGTQVILSDSPQLFNQYAAKENTETITGVWTYSTTSIPKLDSHSTTTNQQFVTAKQVNDGFVSLSTSTAQVIAGAKTFSATTTLTSGALVTTAYACNSGSANLQLCNKSYIDGVASAGASDANTTTKGIVEEATVAEINSYSSTGGTGAKLFMTPAAFSVSNFASTTSSASTTQYATSASFSTTTNFTSGKTVIIMASMGSVSSGIGLYIKPSGSATTTLQGLANCNTSDCPTTYIASYTPTFTGTAQIYGAAGPSSNPTVLGAAGNITILRLNP